MWWITDISPENDIAQGLLQSTYSSIMADYSTLGSSIANSSSAGAQAYGITTGAVIYDTPAEVNISATINPKTVTEPNVDVIIKDPGLIAPEAPIVTVEPFKGPEFKGVSLIEFQPMAPQTPSVTINPVNPVTLSFPPSANNDGQWIQQNGGVASLHQQELIGQGTGGTLDAVSLSTADGSQNFNLSLYSTDATGISGAAHGRTSNGIQNFDWTNQTSSHAVMKLVGSQHIDIKNMDIKFIGVGNKPEVSNYLMLFHTDAHNFNDQDSIWTLDADTNVKMSGQKIIFYGVQSHASRTTGSGMINNGTITTDIKTSTITSQGTTHSGLNPYKRIIFTTIDGDGMNVNAYNRYFYFRNNGIITTNGTSDILANFATPGTATGGTEFENNGTIVLNGQKSIGIVIQNILSPFGNSKVLLNNPVYLRGDESFGLQIADHTFDLSKSTIKFVIGDESNSATSAGNATGNDTSYVEGTVGIVLSATGSNTTAKEFDINLGAKSKDGIGVLVQNGILTLDSTGVNYSIVSDGGINNILVATSRGTEPVASITINSGTILEAKNGFSQIGLYAEKSGIINSAADVSVTGDGSKGLMANISGTITNTGNLNVIGGVYTDTSNTKIGTVGIASIGTGSSVTSTTGNINIDVSGKESTGIYTHTGIIDVHNVTIKTSSGAFNLYSNVGNIKLTNSNLETGQGSLLFYTDGSGTFDMIGTTAKVKGGTDATNRGTAFYYKGTGIPLTAGNLDAYFTNRFSGTAATGLTLDMEAGSRLFIVDNVIIDLSTTNISGITTGPNMIGSTDYKTYMMYKSLLNINQDVNLDSLIDDYNKLEIATSSVTLDAGKSLTGGQEGQIAIAQENGLDSLGALLPIGTVTLTNNGIIALSGSKSTGMYAAHGIINNVSNLAVGVESLGIYSLKGSQTSNTGNITIGEGSAGIFAKNDDISTPANPKPSIAGAERYIDVTNNGSITTTGTTKGYGIYIDNYDGFVAEANSKLQLGMNSNINLSSITGAVDLGDAVGLYAKRTTVSTIGGNAGSVTVGTNGIGIVADGSDLTLNNFTLNLYGNNAIGFQMVNGSTLNNLSPAATGTINIAGQNITLFNLDSSINTFNQAFTINVAPGSTFSYGSVIDSSIYFNSSANLTTGNVFLNGKKTEALFDTGSTIGAVGDKTMGMALDGVYSGAPTLAADGVNKGIITLQNDSVGMYGKTGVSLLNDGGTITIGDNGAGIFVDNAGLGLKSAVNNGKIYIGDSSVGLYGKDVLLVENGTGSKIEALGKTNTVGMRVDSGNVAVMKNDGEINLSGDNLIGMYSGGTGAKTLINNNTIILANNTKNNSNIGIYSKDLNDIIQQNRTIQVGAGGIGVYGRNITLGSLSETKVGSEGIAVHSTGTGAAGATTVTINAGAKVVTDGVAIYAKDAVDITDYSAFSLGVDNYGVLLLGTGQSTYENSAGNTEIGTNSIYAYSATNSGSTITNKMNVEVKGNNAAVLYAKATETITNSGVINLTGGVDNLGIYSEAGTIVNGVVGNNAIGQIFVGAGGIATDGYGIGIGVQNGARVTNHADITLSGDRSIGIFANGVGTTVNNNGNIYLNPSSDVSQMIGIYADNGSVVTNNGHIVSGNNLASPTDYRGDGAKSGLYGMVIKGGSTLVNNGKIEIYADNSAGIYLDKAVIKNYGQITVHGSESQGLRYVMHSDTQGYTGVALNPINVSANVNDGLGEINSYGDIDPSATNKQVGNIGFDKDSADNNAMKAYYLDENGVKHFLDPSKITYNGVPDNVAVSGVGVYIDTLGKTKPLEGGNFLAGNDNSLIIGAEAATETNAKTILVDKGVTDKFMNDYSPSSTNYNGGVSSGSLTWIATLVYDTDPNSLTYGTYSRVLLQKRSYTDFAGKNEDVYNFSDGLEQLYGMAKAGSLDKVVFNKITDIGQNEEKLLFQAYDEMMGQPYANTQQRIMASGNIIDKGIDNLFKWDTASKQSNKVQAIGGRNNYKTNTAGVVDYKQTSGGIVYLNEHETVKLGNASGWYAGLLQSRFDFKDIGESKEDATVGKIGVYKSTSFDNNDSLNWTIKGDITGGYHKMNRKFLVVDEIYNAKGDYYSYGMNVTNEISKDFRVSKSVKIGALASLELGYGKFTDIKEDKGEIKLEVKGNDYYSIKPAVGGRISFDKKIGAALTFKTELLAVVEQELGETTNARNQAKVADTAADYFNLRKDKREKTNGKIGLNLELGTSKFGFNINGEYNTEGENSQIGAGFKFVF